MNLLRIAFCSGLAIWLQSCDNVVITDGLKRSSSEAVIPLGPVRVPSVDSLDKAQLSISVSGLRGGDVPSKIRKSSFGGSEIHTELDGPANQSISPIQGDVSVSIWNADHFRTAIGFELGSTGGTGSVEEGFRFGHTLSVEGFIGLGAGLVHTRADWEESTVTDNDDSGDPPTVQKDSTIADQTDPRFFARAGVHVGMRRFGPWAEYELFTQNLFTAPRSKAMLEVDGSTFAAGWTFQTSMGSILLFGRETSLGAEWIPSVGVQWTQRISLE